MRQKQCEGMPAQKLPRHANEIQESIKDVAEKVAAFIALTTLAVRPACAGWKIWAAVCNRSAVVCCLASGSLAQRHKAADGAP